MKQGIPIAVVLASLGLIGGFFAYANDWQREQDKRISAHDTLIEKQKVLLEMQIKLNEQYERKQMYRGFSPQYKKYRQPTVHQPSGTQQ